MVGLVLFLVLLGLGLFLVLPSADKGDPSPSQVSRVFAGLPQRGSTLGSDRAPVTVTVFSDTQCPACRNFTLHNLPRIVNSFVRSGQVQLRLVPVALRGRPSVLGGEASYAAGERDRMWQFNSLLLLSQRADGLGKEAIVKAAAQAGIDPQLLISAIPAQKEVFEQGALGAKKLSVSETPSFLIERRQGGTPRLFVSSRTDARDLDEEIRSLLSGSSP